MISNTESLHVADQLTIRAWQTLCDPILVRRWLGGTSALAGGKAPVDACAKPEIRRRLEQQLDWFAGTNRRPSESIAVR